MLCSNGLVVLLVTLVCISVSTTVLDLPEKHKEIFLKRKYPEKCSTLPSCMNGLGCYGYEDDCEGQKFEADWPQFCEKREKRQYWNQGDFGYIKMKKNLMSEICRSENHSSFVCTERMQYCEGRNIFMDFRHPKKFLNKQHPVHVFSKNEIGGKCEINEREIERRETPRLDGNLITWFPEVRNFSNIDFYGDKLDNDSDCDIIISKPTVLMKLDQGDNMYHHICGQLNLYMTLLMNDSIEFSKDFYIVRWDWSTRDYIDYFPSAWNVFTEHQMINARQWLGKRVCFKNVLFPFLPRMLLGLFYNAPLGHTCEGSGMMKSFTQFFLHRMKITQEDPIPGRIRVTLLVRESYENSKRKREMYRKILNQDQLVAILKRMSEIDLKVVNYNREIPFKKQLEITHNSDIFIGMHGAGLTHFLFLPDWAVAFELYDCEAICFRDLARLRGVKHLTWQNHDLMTKHKAKDTTNQRYWNFSFDQNEFERLVLLATQLLKENDVFNSIYNGTAANFNKKDEL